MTVLELIYKLAKVPEPDTTLVMTCDSEWRGYFPASGAVLKMVLDCGWDSRNPEQYRDLDDYSLDEAARTCNRRVSAIIID